MASILHLILERDLGLARSVGEWRPPSLAEEGFIHCSRDEEQMLRVAQRLYAGRADLLALEVDTERLTHPVVTEPSRSGELYPHIYGPLDLAAVEKVLRLIPDGDTGFSLSAE